MFGFCSFFPSESFKTLSDFLVVTPHFGDKVIKITDWNEGEVILSHPISIFNEEVRSFNFSLFFVISSLSTIEMPSISLYVSFLKTINMW